MRFFKSWRQVREERQAELESLFYGEDWFAWYPVWENDGRLVWLEVVHLDYGVYKDNKGVYRARAGNPIVFLKETRDGKE